MQIEFPGIFYIFPKILLTTAATVATVEADGEQQMATSGRQWWTTNGD